MTIDLPSCQERRRGKANVVRVFCESVAGDASTQIWLMPTFGFSAGRVVLDIQERQPVVFDLLLLQRACSAQQRYERFCPWLTILTPVPDDLTESERFLPLPLRDIRRHRAELVHCWQVRAEELRPKFLSPDPAFRTQTCGVTCSVMLHRPSRQLLGPSSILLRGRSSKSSPSPRTLHRQDTQLFQPHRGHPGGQFWEPHEAAPASLLDPCKLPIRALGLRQRPVATVQNHSRQR